MKMETESKSIVNSSLNPLVDEIVDAFNNLTSLDSEISNQIDSYFIEIDKDIDRCMKSSQTIEKNNKEINTNILPCIIFNEEEMVRLSKALSAMENEVIPSLNYDLDQIENVIQQLEDKMKKDKISSSINISNLINRFVSSPVNKDKSGDVIDITTINLTSKETLIKAIDIE